MTFFSRFTTVRMDLENLIYISYRVPVSRIRPLVPPILSIASDDENRAYVSFVAMRCRNVRLSACSWPRFNYDQMNLRTYVIDPQTSGAAVYFFQSGVSIGIVPVITRLMGIPWQKIAFNLDKRSPSTYRASGHWRGAVAFEIESRRNEPLQELVVRHLTGPMMGFMGSQGNLCSFNIRHRSLEVQAGTLHSIRFPFAIQEGLVTEIELKQPDSVLMVPEAEFEIYLPPHRVSERR